MSSNHAYPGVPYATIADFDRGEHPGWVKVPEDAPAYRIGARWFVRCMVGCVIGRLSEGVHSVTEHDDGTITVEPSLVMSNGWHGWLRGGVFEVIDFGRPPGQPEEAS